MTTSTTTMTIRNVPVEVRNELASRAARAGQSLQEYMLGEVVELAAKPSVTEWVATVRASRDRSTSSATRASIRDALAVDRR